ncbi:hypothetical protein [Saccharopolyspora pogona]|uniref:hypothetical protein n=1 Tax=Saccharopolyspora pogona TaxID=333966 RepID=UPI00168961C0|nr:hypothetical protein [Saccharopolyspora pogona]
MAVKTVFKITYRQCGHTEEKDLSKKKAADRAGFARWLEQKATCTDCWRAEQGHPPRGEWIEDRAQWLATKREQENQDAEQWAKDAQMPPLNGSEKAVAWASRVRHQALRELYIWAVQDDHAPDDYDLAEETARTIDRASWWLDQRKQIEDDPGALLELLQSAADGGGVDCENTY